MPTKAGIIYQMQWLTVENNNMEVDIYDNSVQIDSSSTEQTYNLSPSGNPLSIEVVDNDENKLSPIRAKKAVIRFLNDDTFNYSTFSTGEDGRFKVIITCDAGTIFDGWLQQGDIYEPFLYQKDQEVELTAVDGLAFLKGVPLTDFNGNVPKNENRIMDYIAWALRKTGSFLNIYTMNNLRDLERPNAWKTAASFTAPHTISLPQGYARFFRVGTTINIAGSASNNGNKVVATVTDLGSLGGVVTITGSVTNEALGPTITWTDVTSNGNIYDVLYLNAKTFEGDAPGTMLDCYTILQRILGQSCFITQFRGDWWIVRVKEMRQDFQQYVDEFDNTGGLAVPGSTRNLEKAIGLKDTAGTSFPGTPDAISFFSKKQTKRTISRPFGSYELDYNYEFPKEIPCNSDFSRHPVGDDIANLPDETDEDGNVMKMKKYILDCWTLLRGAGATSAAPNCDAYLKRGFVDGYEKLRCVVLTLPSVQGNPKNYIESEDIPIGAQDKFTISFDWSTETDVGTQTGLNEPVGSVWLAATDGTFYKLSQTAGPGGTPAWLTTNNADSFGVNTNFIIPDINAPTTQWISYSIDAPPVPKAGKLRIRLNASGAFGATSADNFNVRFTNLKFDYKPFISGSYAKFSGQSFKTTRPGVYKAKAQEQIYICNAPRPIIKGALLKKSNAGGFYLCTLFYDGQEYFYANDGENDLSSYQEQITRAAHNQFRNGDETYQLTAQGLAGVSQADIVHRIFNRDIEPNTNNQAYQLVRLEQNWKNDEWNATMVKNFDKTIGYIKNDTGEFKYIES